METGQSQEACQGAQTPLIGYVLYKSTKPFTTAQNAEVVVKIAGTGPTTGTMVGKHKKVMEDLKPSTRYYVLLAAENSVGVGPFHTAALTFRTADAPKPDRVTDVMVMPRDEALEAEWVAPHPDSVDQTDLKISEYHVQYRTSETTSRSPGDWMPMPTPMMVEGDMTETSITGLKNGTMYDVQVRAKNSAGGVGSYSRQTDDTSAMPSVDAGDPEDEDDMTETPALPLFGILALLGGLLAAGRARLRR